MSDIVKPVAPERPMDADDEVMSFFRKHKEIVPIPVEMAEQIRSLALNGESEPEPAPEPEKPRPQPQVKPQPVKQHKPVMMDPPKEKAVTAYWEPCGKEARRQHRWKAFGLISLLMSLIISGIWLALQTGDATIRLACPIIIIAHLVITGALLWAWLGR